MDLPRLFFPYDALTRIANRAWPTKVNAGLVPLKEGENGARRAHYFILTTPQR
jgi:hypothetical protein